MGAPTSLLDAPAPGSARATLRNRLARLRPRSRPPTPWYERAETWAGFAVVALCCLFVLFQEQPHLLLRDTTAAGGDTGAHVWWPAYLRDHLLPHWRLAGWTPDFYTGFPAGQFYFPLPALLVVVLDAVLPYNIAFKLVTALGPVALPVGAHAFGRGFRAPRPAPAAMAVAATTFLFFRGNPGTSTAAMGAAFNQRIMGGTLASNLAGEFSFTIALALALFFLGALAWTLDHRRRAWLPAVLLAATVLSHIVVAIFAVIGAVVVLVAHRPIRNLRLGVAIGAVGALLSAVWTMPFLATRDYTTDMGYEEIRQFLDYLFPWYFWYLYALAAVAIAAAVFRRRRAAFELVALTALMGVVFRVWDVFDTPAWNLRFLPFWYLGLFLIAAIGAAELVRGLAALVAHTVEHGWWYTPALEPGSDLDTAGDAHNPGTIATPSQRSVARVVTAAMVTLVLSGAALVQIHNHRDFLDFWVRYNYTGYERADYLVAAAGKSSDEYRALIEALDELPPGRALWEPDSQAIGAYGTPLALMLLPYWTDGRIASMEGVYYEAAASTPYLFLTTATLTATGKASNPVRGLPYKTIADFDLGVRYLQLLGVRYYLAESAEAKQRADAAPELSLVARAADLDGQPPTGWNIYEVADASLVEPLTTEPVVVNGVATGEWQDEVGVPWFDDRSALDRILVNGGPGEWPRSGPKQARSRAGSPLPAVRVSDIKETDDSISFHVSRTGVPVLVKTSYFPNWRASGAEGPWRATPNFMVVVPTSKDVTLEYGTTTAEWLGRAGTVAGVIGVGVLAWWWRPGRRKDDEADENQRESEPGGVGAPAVR